MLSMCSRTLYVRIPKVSGILVVSSFLEDSLTNHSVILSKTGILSFTAKVATFCKCCPRGVGLKSSNQLSNEESKDSDTHLETFLNVYPRVVGLKSSGYLKYQEEWHSDESKHIWTNIMDFSPCIVGQSDQNSEIRVFQANSLREYPVNVVKKAFLAKCPTFIVVTNSRQTFRKRSREQNQESLRISQ